MRILHTMLRVGDLDRSIAFYTEVLGMRLLRRHDYPDGKFTLAFVGYQDEQDGAVLELTYNWGVDNYELGTAYGHVALEVAQLLRNDDEEVELVAMVDTFFDQQFWPVPLFLRATVSRTAVHVRGALTENPGTAARDLTRRAVRLAARIGRRVRPHDHSPGCVVEPASAQEGASSAGGGAG